MKFQIELTIDDTECEAMVTTLYNDEELIELGEELTVSDRGVREFQQPTPARLLQAVNKYIEQTLEIYGVSIGEV